LHPLDFRRIEGGIHLIAPAPNGFGKTVVLTLVNAFFNKQFSSFSKYQFRTFTLQFDNQESVVIRNDGPPDLFAEPRKDQRDILISLLSQIRSVDVFRLKLPEGLPPLSRYLAFMEPVGPDTWIDENTDEVMSTADAISRYSTLLPPQFLKFLELQNG
jgi:hypothetical protein